MTFPNNNGEEENWTSKIDNTTPNKVKFFTLFGVRRVQRVKIARDLLKRELAETRNASKGYNGSSDSAPPESWNTKVMHHPRVQLERDLAGTWNTTPNKVSVASPLDPYSAREELSFLLTELKKSGDLLKRELAETRNASKGYNNGSSDSAPPESWNTKVMLGAGILCFAMPSIPYDIKDGARVPKLFNYSAELFHVVTMFVIISFNLSLLGLLMARKSPKFAVYSGYVSLFYLLFAVGVIAFFTVMWAFERI